MEEKYFINVNKVKKGEKKMKRKFENFDKNNPVQLRRWVIEQGNIEFLINHYEDLRIEEERVLNFIDEIGGRL